MQNGQSDIYELFNADRIFKIPNYQRTYTWQEENLKDFLDDLVNQRGNKSYFLGTFLFHNQNRRGDYEILDIVDGQQRLTTIIIFTKVLIERLLELSSDKVSNKTYRRFVKDSDGVYKLELDNEDNNFLNTYILENNKADTFETPAQKNLIQAKQYLKKEIENISKSSLEKIFDLISNATIINYVVQDFSDATLIFELLNDRGRRLTNLESVKSFLMYKVGSLDIKNHEQPLKVIQDCIAAIYRNVEKYNLNENDVLRYHTIAFEKTNSENFNNPSKFIKNQINQLFIDNVEDVKIKETIVSYITRLKESFDIFIKLRNNEVGISSLDDFHMIGKVGPYYPFLMIIYKNDKDRLEEFCKILTAFTFRASFIRLQNRDEKLYEHIRNDDDFFIVFSNILHHNWWNINNRTQETLDYDNYYEWVKKNMVKFILFKYENHLRKEEGHPLLTIHNYFSQDPRTKYNIEHISARKSQLEFDEDFNESYLHSIGNLVLDTVSSNSKKGRKGIDKKIESYKAAPLMSQNKINNEELDWQNTDSIQDFIIQREKELKTFIKQRLLHIND